MSTRGLIWNTLRLLLYNYTYAYSIMIKGSQSCITIFMPYTKLLRCVSGTCVWFVKPCLLTTVRNSVVNSEAFSQSHSSTCPSTDQLCSTGTALVSFFPPSYLPRPLPSLNRTRLRATLTIPVWARSANAHRQSASSKSGMCWMFLFFRFITHERALRAVRTRRNMPDVVDKVDWLKPETLSFHEWR